MGYLDKKFLFISAFQKAIRWCEVNASRYFARELMNMRCPGGILDQLILIAAEDVGLADPSLVEYERQCSDHFESLIKQNEMKKRDAVKFPVLCRIVDQAVIAAAIAYKSRLLPQISFATLYDIYQHEDFSKDPSEYIARFLGALKERDEKEALYYAYVAGIFLDSMDQILTMIERLSGTRNGNLIPKWVEEYRSGKELLMLAGSIVLLCRDLSYLHGEYNGFISLHLSSLIKEADIPDRAYDMHTAIGKRKGRCLKHFFDEGATVKNERFPNNWDKAGTNAYLCAEKEGLGKADEIIMATKKKNMENIKNHIYVDGFIIKLPFDFKEAVLTQARTSKNRPYAFIVEFNDGSRKFMKGPFKDAKYAQGHVICNEVKRKLASKYLHPIQCEVNEYAPNSVFLKCEELGRADLKEVTFKATDLDGEFIVLEYGSNDVVPDPLEYLRRINKKNRDVWIEVMVNYCFRWVFGIADTARRNLMLQRSTGKIFSTDETGIENVSHEKIWGKKKPNKKVFKHVSAFIESDHLDEVLTEVKRWNGFLDVIRRDIVPLSKQVEARIDKLSSNPKMVFDV